MGIDNDRPQDVGRAHTRRRTGPDAETAAVLDRYRQAIRAELADTLDELRPERAQLTLEGGAERIRPALVDRLKLWDLAIKLGRELANGGDLPAELPAVDPAAPAVSPLRKGAPKLTAAERRAIGA